MKEFKDRVAVITGAASGIGRAMTITFINAGMKVVLADVDEDILNTTIQTLKDDGATVLGVVTDVSKPDQVKELAEETMSTFGGVHILCNNAGVSDSRLNSWDIPIESWHWVWGVNVMGVIHGIHYFMPIMIEQDTEAHIVNTSSIFGLNNEFFNTPYGISKHAVVVLTENLHLELLARRSKVKTSVLCPGPVNTNFFVSIDRNRPVNVPVAEVSEREAIFIKGFKTWIKCGLDPMEVARQVIMAIAEEKFYIITDNGINSYVEQRMKNILNRTNPILPLLPEEFVSILRKIKREREAALTF